MRREDEVEVEVDGKPQDKTSKIWGQKGVFGVEVLECGREGAASRIR